MTKIAAGVLLRDGAVAIMERWSGTAVKSDPKVAEQIKQFFARHGVKNVVVTDEPIGCPHEQPDDFPIGQECPFCPSWRGKQGIQLGVEAQDEDEVDDFEEVSGREIDESNDDEEDEGPDDLDDRIVRMNAIVGDVDEVDFDDLVGKALEHLRKI